LAIIFAVLFLVTIIILSWMFGALISPQLVLAIVVGLLAIIGSIVLGQVYEIKNIIGLINDPHKLDETIQRLQSIKEASK